jgi:hypothetical protein
VDLPPGPGWRRVQVAVYLSPWPAAAAGYTTAATAAAGQRVLVGDSAGEVPLAGSEFKFIAVVESEALDIRVQANSEGSQGQNLSSCGGPDR